LKDNDALKQEGVPGFLSADSFKTAWTDYQGWVVERLNDKTAGNTPLCNTALRSPSPAPKAAGLRRR